MIDAHIHVVPPNLPGVGVMDPCLGQPLSKLANHLRSQMDAAGVNHALAMGSWNNSEEDPLGVHRTLALAQSVPGLHAIGIADPTRDDAEFLRRAEQQLTDGRVIALKAYLGYLHYPPDHPAYRPYYEFAARFHLPMIFHTGDTYSPYAKLRFAHPLGVDEVAVDHPEVRFVVAHVGNPWMLDAAEVVYKNVNVWCDLSGLLVGSSEELNDPENRAMRLDLEQRLGQAFRYAERPNRFLFGSDWPLVPMRAYRDFIGQVIPEEHHSLVFEENARRLFRKLTEN